MSGGSGSGKARVRFDPDGIEVEVPVGSSFLEAARMTEAQVGSACGGVCACSTCHVYVREGFDDLSEVKDREEDIMDKAFDVRPTSRLGCQAKMLAERTYVVEVSRESRQAFLDEHPEIRNALAKGEAQSAHSQPQAQTQPAKPAAP